MTDERLARRLAELRDFADEAAFVVSHGRENFVAATRDGALLRNAAGHVLVKIATVAERLPGDYRAAHPLIDWRKITLMHDLVTHHDDKVNDDLVFSTLAVDIPQFLDNLDVDPEPPAR
ncbi:MAG: DUF86 domain-containing protein [Micrococcales bacterium]|nr:DUF86 domain-containing protein [Micrococcales bacterium]